ncbi:MAG: MBL fold metallo-hydrolase [Syntrophomonadaceae bacterium]|jgi:7,8-dihydropterin-6-yl-methyl-4-(beta-D-ribofuranosyl)aminobenzene 5'-phosphate synthase
MKVGITILVENTTPAPGFQGEYGFAALVEVDEKSFLFDTGSADAVFTNAKAKGIDLAQVNDVVISHGHFDHTGGLLAFLKMGGPKKVYGHASLFIPRYVMRGGIKKEIGVSFKPQEITAHGAEFIITHDFTAIHPRVFVSGEIPRISDFEDVGGSFWMDDGDKDKLSPDMIADDMAMIINHPQGLIIISGCAHAGIINTIAYACLKTGINKVLAFIGGTHLIMASEQRLTKTAAALKDFDVQKIIACHCTGFNALVRLRNELGDRLIKGETAMRFQF